MESAHSLHSPDVPDGRLVAGGYGTRAIGCCRIEPITSGEINLIQFRIERVAINCNTARLLRSNRAARIVETRVSIEALVVARIRLQKRLDHRSMTLIVLIRSLLLPQSPAGRPDHCSDCLACGGCRYSSFGDSRSQSVEPVVNRAPRLIHAVNLLPWIGVRLPAWRLSQSFSHGAVSRWVYCSTSTSVRFALIYSPPTQEKTGQSINACKKIVSI